MQDWNNSETLLPELLQSCFTPSMYKHRHKKRVDTTSIEYGSIMKMASTKYSIFVWYVGDNIWPEQPGAVFLGVEDKKGRKKELA